MIRKFLKKDAKQVSTIIIRNLLEINSKDYDRSVIDKFCSKYSEEELIRKANEKLIFVYEKEGNVIGTGTIEDNYINAVYVLPEEQKKGIGKEIVEYLEKYAKENNKNWLKLHSTITALEFYKKIGYKIHHKVYGRVNGTTYFMTKYV